MTDLPVKQILPQLLNALQSQSNVVLISPPGSGKSTYLPLQLLQQSWLIDKRIIMLEPRRLAARNVAYWLAHQLNESIGKTVGYRMRGDTVIGKSTRIEVVTEGILTRILQNNPELSEYGLIIFDEFHERNLNSDLALSLCLDLQQNLRDDLRMLVMSATLDAEPVAAILDNAKVLRSEGRVHPVAIHYSNSNIDLQNTSAIAHTIKNVLQTEEGDVLVFLPGAGEITRVYEALTETLTQQQTNIFPLYGNLSQSQQENAIAPSINGQRKVVLTTNIAETSLTIEGIRTVIDCGYQRVAIFDAGSGMMRLDTIRVAQSNADQRCGRAGRLGPGQCYRLWTEATQKSLLPANDPEITNADLTSLVLELAQWGVRDISGLSWLTPPATGNFEQAQSLLRQLGAINENNSITEHGKLLQELGTHPRLAHMIVTAKQFDLGVMACDIAALLGERDILVNENSVDLQLRLEALHRMPHTKGIAVHKTTLQRVQKESEAWQKQLGFSRQEINADKAGFVLAMAYPDRIAKQREQSTTHYLLSNGKGVVLSDNQILRNQPYLIVAKLDGRQQNAKIFLAAGIKQSEIIDLYGSSITRQQIVYWDKKEKAVKAIEQTRLFQLILGESRLESPDDQMVLSALLAGIYQEGIDVLPWNDEMRQWQRRVMLVHQFDNKHWPDVSDSALMATLEHWLGPFLQKITRVSQIAEQHLKQALDNLLDWNQQQQLDQLVPTHFIVPSGSRLRIDYCEGELPVLRVRLQEMFGLETTPSILQGKQQLLLHLLSPAQRPIQVTKDLVSFWQNTYAEVKKDLKGRYPKHYWPDDPLQAEPTRRTKSQQSFNLGKK